VSAPCLKCGAPTDQRIEFGGLMEVAVFMCEQCKDDDMIEFEERRRQFQELIDAGVSRRVANMIMIGRIDQAAKS
jgi:hypothetical protein